MGGHPLADWVVETARLPIAFAQVREDPLLDLSLLTRITKPGVRGMMIASGGCTAASLTASGRLSHLHLVDFNPAQLALTRLKLDLLQTSDTVERLRLLGHVDLPVDQRAAALSTRLEKLQLPSDCLGPLSLVARLGPDHVGRYEILFSHLRAELRDFSDEIIAALSMPAPWDRARLFDSHTRLGEAMDRAFDNVMSLENLVHLFSAQATQNSREPFSKHFAGRTRAALLMFSAAVNPYLWQLLVGRFPEQISYPWITATAPDQLPQITTTLGTIDSALARCGEEFDFVHLSNVLDWLSPAQAQHTMALSRRALRPGGFVIIRQLNSTLDLPALGEGFDWLTSEAEAMHAVDRSFFYRSIHLGRKRP